MKHFWDLIKRRKFLSSIILIVIILIGSYFYFNRNKAPNYNIAIAKKGTVVREVSVNGRVKPAKNVDLAFEKIGRVFHVYVEVGNNVKSGQILVALNNDDTYAQLLQAQAGIQNAQATLDELKKGTRPEDIKIAQSELDKTKQDLNNYYSGALNVLNDSYSKADDAVKKQTDSIFSNDESNSPQLTFTSSDSQAQIDVQWQRTLVRDALNSWKSELDSLKINGSRDLIDQSITNSQKRLSLFRDFLSRLQTAVENGINITSATIDTYKSNINTAKAEINTAATNIGNQEQSIASQKITVEKTKNQLNLKIAGSTPEQIAAQEATVKQAEANVKNYQAQLEKTIIRAPFDGIVTKQDAKVGEIISQNTPIVSLMSNAKFEIEANVPEADIAKIKIGDATKTTLDAYGNDVIFEANVIKIDPAETLIEGVATYKTTFQFIKESELIKSGMTANLDILTDKKENVIYIPQRAIKTNNEKTVRILDKNKIVRETIVETGLKGSDGNIEIINGINEGEQIITSEQ